MNRIILAFTLSIVVAVVVHLAKVQPGSVEMVWLGYRISMNAVTLLVLALLGTFLFMCWGRLWSWLEMAPIALKYKHRKDDRKAAEKLVMLAMRAYSQGEYERARKLATQAYLKDPQNVLLVMMAVRCGAVLPEGVEQKLLNDKTMGSTIQKQLFRQARRQGNLDNALVYGRQLLAGKDVHDDDYQQIFDTMMQCKKYASASQVLSKMKKFEGHQNIPLPIMQATLLGVQAKKYEDSEYKEAIKLYNQALNIAPNLVVMNLALARVYLAQNEVERARKVAVQFWLSTPRLDVWLFIISTFGHGPLDKKEVKQLQNLCTKQPNQMMGHFCRALLFERMGQLGDAKAQLLKARDAGNTREMALALARVEDALTPGSRAGYPFLAEAQSLPRLQQPGEDALAAYRSAVDIYGLNKVAPQMPVLQVVGSSRG